MRKPAHAWWTFAAVVVVALAGFAWMSRAVLGLDDAQRINSARAEREERLRLALWRIDSAVALVLAAENARRPAEFRSFHPPEKAWNPSREEIPASQVLLASPLLALPAPPLQLHFEIGPGGNLDSPQTPPAAFQALVAGLGPNAAHPDEARSRLERLRSLLGPKDKGGKGGSPQLEQLAQAANLAASNPPVAVVASAQNPALAQQQLRANYGNELPGQQIEINRTEQNARQQAFQGSYANLDNAARNGYVSRQLNNTLLNPDPVLAVGPFAPVWIGTELFLVRRADLSAGSRVQGVWLDWSALRTSLLGNIQDLLPEAQLVPDPTATANEDGRTLASLPVRLDVTRVPVTPGSRWTALRLALVAAWACLALAAVALAILLHGVLALSERRAEFVSAVTHELRTPLTTFRLYSEMLAGGMVSSPEQQRGYLSTLCAEADRLGHLVENVLAYARLERGNARNRRERIALADLVDRVRPRLRDRAALAGMELRADLDPAVASTLVEVDVGAVEQILFNLVDNAAKYGTPEEGGGVIHLEALPERGKFAMLRVRDHGRGVSPDVLGRLFEPFHRSAEKAAGSAPGVGLGLALCRKLSRSLGGDLRLDADTTPGAAFILSLPRPNGPAGT